MMPDLGKYAQTVLSSYVATLVLLALIIVLTWVRHKRAKADLDAVEARKNG